MLFTSYEFLIFFPIFFILYWLVNKQLRIQNLLVMISSYIFYGWWDWRFLGLIVLSSITDFLLGNAIYKTPKNEKRKRRLLLIFSLIVNLGILGFFKYFNFFIDSFANLMSSVGLNSNTTSLSIILPVGISFYTFQTLSYTIDIYYKKIKPTKDIIAFFAFVSFWPQLVAGPIERAKNLLPQFHVKRKFDFMLAKDGARQILWGFFKKVVVADQCANLVELCFSNHDTISGSLLILGVIFFAFQIYCDFSGYSDIAIGTAKLFGIKLMQNFAFPYFSRDVAEFWRRWHISLSTWFRDYVYIPLGGSRVSKWKRIRNIVITFTVSGLWHGANWTFVFWGFLNGLYYIPLMLANKHKAHSAVIGEGNLFGKPKEYLKVILTFFLICITWVFFRASSITEAFQYIYHIFSNEFIFAFESLGNNHRRWLITGLLFISVTMIFEWFNRSKQHGLEIPNISIYIRWAIYLILAYLIIGYWGEEKPFIYFQF
jgi:D-alanyl-lipoteichoic acid acyltransferase DltB (MBOAT superfamily)